MHELCQLNPTVINVKIAAVFYFIHMTLFYSALAITACTIDYTI